MAWRWLPRWLLFPWRPLERRSRFWFSGLLLAGILPLRVRVLWLSVLWLPILRWLLRRAGLCRPRFGLLSGAGPVHREGRVHATGARGDAGSARRIFVLLHGPGRLLPASSELQ